MAEKRIDIPQVSPPTQPLKKASERACPGRFVPKQTIIDKSIAGCSTFIDGVIVCDREGCERNRRTATASLTNKYQPLENCPFNKK